MTTLPFNFEMPEDKKKKKSTAEPKAEPVIKPHEHDVLCGRGGLTNHHPGNAWYRRLVRSNRPLYRASPNHTKLLVSKAIVHHVQTQSPPGRFLECHQTTGLWYPVPYKKAVDKTSQALRERARESDGAVNVPLMAWLLLLLLLLLLLSRTIQSKSSRVSWH